MNYTVEVLPRAIKELERTPEQFYQRIVKVIDDLEIEPRPKGTAKLKGYENRWRIRLGDYRILYEVNDTDRSVVVFRVAHRKEACR